MFNDRQNEGRNIFLFRSNAKLQRFGDENRKTINVTMTNPYTIFDKQPTSSTPIWIYIVSIIAGAFVLVAVSYAMHKFGFFQRKKREELKRLTVRTSFFAEGINYADLKTMADEEDYDE